MKKKDCITIGIIGISEDMPVLDNINSVLSQSYNSIEIIITMVNDSRRIFNNLNRAIVNFRKDNIVQIKYKFFEKSQSIVEHFEYIRDNAIGEYICFLEMQDSLYDENAIQNCIEVIEQDNEYNAYMFSTLVFDDDTFNEMKITCGAEMAPLETDVSFIFKNNKRFLFREYENESYKDIVHNMWIHSVNIQSVKILCRNIINRTQEEKLVAKESMIVEPEQYKNVNIFEQGTN